MCTGITHDRGFGMACPVSSCNDLVYDRRSSGFFLVDLFPVSMVSLEEKKILVRSH
jgi:hypothetical protein